MTTSVSEGPGARDRHVLRDLGWSANRAGDDLVGTLPVVAEMHVPGTDRLRTSILAAWADVMAGLLAVDAIAPRVPVTLELDVQLYEPAPTSGVVRGSGRLVKAGRSVMVASVDFTTGDGTPLAFAAASFMAAPDATMRITGPTSADRVISPAGRLRVPFAIRAGCERTAPGEAVLPHSDEVLNASNTINGGLIALAAEEAALSLTPGATLSALGLRYLQPARVGPVVARADVRHGLGQIEVRDAGNQSRLCVMATSRTFDG